MILPDIRAALDAKARHRGMSQNAQNRVTYWFGLLMLAVAGYGVLGWGFR